MMAFFSTARLALRRSIAAAPRAASRGVIFRQVSEEPSSRMLLHGELLPRHFSTDPAGSEGSLPKIDKYFPPRGIEVDPDLKMEYIRLYEKKRKELIDVLVKAVDTCEPAHRDRVLEKHKELQQVRQEFLAKAQVKGQVKSHEMSTDNGATRSKTAGGHETLSFTDFLSIAIWSMILGLILSVLESKLSGGVNY